MKNNIKVLDFYADWCGPCKAMEYELKELPYEITKINVDENRGLTKKYGVLSIPTLIVLKDNEEVLKIRGFINKDELIEKIESVSE